MYKKGENKKAIKISEDLFRMRTCSQLKEVKFFKKDIGGVKD